MRNNLLVKHEGGGIVWTCEFWVVQAISTKGIIYRDNNPKHTSWTTKEVLEQKKCDVLDQLSQSLDLNEVVYEGNINTPGFKMFDGGLGYRRHTFLN